jgi:hypothetical protein
VQRLDRSPWFLFCFGQTAGAARFALAGAVLAIVGCGDPAWDDLGDVPPELADGDDDTVAGLSCAAGQLPYWDGAQWLCGDDGDVVDGLSCTSGQVARFDGAGWSCSDEILATLSCAADQFAQWDGAAWICGAPPPYTAGAGLAMSGQEISLDGSSCAADGVLKWDDGASDWVCADDEVGIDGAGTAGFLSLFTDATALADSPVYAAGGLVGIGTAAPAAALDVAGDLWANATSLPWGATSYRSESWAKFFDYNPQYGEFRGLNEVVVDQLAPMTSYGNLWPREYRVHCSPGAYSYVASRIYTGTLTVLGAAGVHYGPGNRAALLFDYTMIAGGYSGSLPAENLTPILSEVTYSSANAGDDIVLTVGEIDPTLGEVNGMRFKWRASDDALVMYHTDELNQSNSLRGGRCYIRRLL